MNKRRRFKAKRRRARTRLINIESARTWRLYDELYRTMHTATKVPPTYLELAEAVARNAYTIGPPVTRLLRPGVD